MILNELRQVRVSGIEPVAHVVSNLLICGHVWGRKDSSGSAVNAIYGLEYMRTQADSLEGGQRHVGSQQKIG